MISRSEADFVTRVILTQQGAARSAKHEALSRLGRKETPHEFFLPHSGRQIPFARRIYRARSSLKTLSLVRNAGTQQMMPRAI
jgi:hypothetical protein